MRATLVPSLLYHPYSDRPYADIPLGALTIASVLEARGFEVEVKDLNLEVLEGRFAWGADLHARAAESVLERDPDVVGFSTLCTSFLHTLRIVEQVRARKPSAFVVLGGPNATAVAPALLESCGHLVDAVVPGEGELVTAALADALAGGTPLERVPGLLTPQHPRGALPRPPLVVDLDALPGPAWHLYPIRRGLDRGWWTALELEAGRGCPFRCTFCTTSPFWGRRYRAKSPRALVAEVLALRERFRVDAFSFVHDLFTCRRVWVEQVCDAFVAAGAPVRWSISSRTDTLDPDLIERLAAAGCRDVYFGVESGSPRIQRATRKRLDLSSARATIAATQTRGIRATASFMLGFPEEDLEDLEETLRLFCIYKAQERAQLHLLALYPGIGLARDPLALRFDAHLPDGPLELHTARDLEWIRARPDLFLNYFYVETPIDRELLKGLQAYYLATTSYLAHLVAAACLGERLTDLAAHWLRSTAVKFDPSRLHNDGLCRMAADIAAHLRAAFEAHGRAALLDDVCAFQRACTAVGGGARSDESRAPPSAGIDLSSRLAPRSPLEVVDLRHDVPAIASAIAEDRAPASRPDPCRYLVYGLEGRVRSRRLDPFTGELIALCLEGRPLADAARALQRRVGAPPGGAELASVIACLRTARDLAADGILRRVG